MAKGGNKLMLVRVLADLLVDGKSYAANDVVEFPAELAESRVKAGQVDDAEAAVDYCVKELGKKPITHEPVIVDAVADAVADGAE